MTETYSLTVRGQKSEWRRRHDGAHTEESRGPAAPFSLRGLQEPLGLWQHNSDLRSLLYVAFPCASAGLSVSPLHLLRTLVSGLRVT